MKIPQSILEKAMSNPKISFYINQHCFIWFGIVTQGFFVEKKYSSSPLSIKDVELPNYKKNCKIRQSIKRLDYMIKLDKELKKYSRR